MDKLLAVAKQLWAFWRALPNAKRLALVVLTGGVLVSVLALSAARSRVRYAYLYTELEPQDAASILQKLDAIQVPHRLDATGTAIKVPEDQVAKLRLDLASQGLPRGGGVGFELFDEMHIGATEFEQQVNLRRALEGELARSILTMQGVKAARVHLVMPERRLFAAREESASASVVLDLSNGDAFGKKEVAAVVHLVAAAVPALNRDRVSVVSTEGVTLHRPSVQGGPLVGASGEDAVDGARNLASQMEAQIVAQLERVVGPGNADVRVNVEIDPTAHERTEEHYEPTKTVLRSEKLSEETAGGTRGEVAGVPGALSNLPDAEEEGTTSEATVTEGGTVLRRSHTRNWEMDRVSEKTVAPAGRLRRVTVAVLVNGTYDIKDGVTVYVPRKPAQMAQLEALVAHAAGINASRGDTLTVSNVEFAQAPSIVEEAPAPQAWRRWWPQLLMAGASAAALALVVLVWRVRRAAKRRNALVTQLRVSEANPAALGGGAGGAPQLPAGEKANSAELRALAVKAATEDSASATLILRGWLNGAGAGPSSRGDLARS